MKRRRTGQHITISTVSERCEAFIPDPLPPDPPLALDEHLRGLLDTAYVALGRLDGMSLLLPSASLLIYMYIRKEAVLSSQIEGTQSSLADLLLFEMESAPGVPIDEVREVSNYVAAMNHGLDRLRSGLPLSLRLMREIHAVLLAKGRGSDREPGEFRRSQNWIGGTRPGNARFVPPPANAVLECMASLERFLHDDPVRTSPLVKAALAHVQFETIHPFLDGNGRLGRLLVTFLLCAHDVLRQPMLYLSLYFKTHRDRYYELLQSVRTDGDWEAWVDFFLSGVIETAEQATNTAGRLLRLFDADRQRIQELGRAAGSALRVHERLQVTPITSIARAAAKLSLSVPAVTNSLERLQSLGLVRELTGHRRNRLYAYDEYIRTLSEGAEPIG